MAGFARWFLAGLARQLIGALARRLLAHLYRWQHAWHAGWPLPVLARKKAF